MLGQEGSFRGKFDVEDTAFMSSVPIIRPYEVPQRAACPCGQWGGPDVGARTRSEDLSLDDSSAIPRGEAQCLCPWESLASALHLLKETSSLNLVVLRYTCYFWRKNLTLNLFMSVLCDMRLRLAGTDYLTGKCVPRCVLSVRNHHFLLLLLGWASECL